MILRYIYSACIVIETADTRICCDPWFSQGIYDGAWFQYPETPDPIATIGPVDYVFISHIHPDHYDPPYLRQLLDANQHCEILIGEENQRFLREKMQRDGFDPKSVSDLTVGATTIQITPNHAEDEINIDSAIAVKDAQFSVVNLNDCPFDQEQVEQIIGFCGKQPDVAFLPYAGAGPFPQAYRFKTAEDRVAAANGKKEQFFQLFQRYLDTLRPRYAVPFAGLYYLGGSKRWMNPLRGVPDAVEVVERFGDSVVVLNEFSGSIDLSCDAISNSRTTPYDDHLREKVLQKFDHWALPYSADPHVSEQELVDKLGRAHLKAVGRLVDPPPGWICFKAPTTQFLCVTVSSPGVVQSTDSANDFYPREEIYLDERLLAGLLDRRYHWNNAEIGSHFEFMRSPENYDRRVYNFLNFLHV